MTRYSFCDRVWAVVDITVVAGRSSMTRRRSCCNIIAIEQNMKTLTIKIIQEYRLVRCLKYRFSPWL